MAHAKAEFEGDMEYPKHLWAPLLKKRLQPNKLYGLLKLNSWWEKWQDDLSTRNDNNNNNNESDKKNFGKFLLES